MGAVIESRNITDKQSAYSLPIYINVPPETASAAVSANKPLAAELISLTPARRTMQLEKCFIRLLETLPDFPVIKDIDVMFNPGYRVDVMKILISAYKRKPYSLIWSGRCSGGRLIYAEEGCADYRTYEISDYDIICII